MQTEPILSPYDGSVVGHMPVCGEAEVEAAIDRALEDRDWQVRQAAEDLRRAAGEHEI